MSCNADTDKGPVANNISQSNYIPSEIWGDNAVLNNVTSLLSRQQSTSKEEVFSLNTPLLVLTNTQGKKAMEANVLLGSRQGYRYKKSVSSDAFVPSLEQVHALATANLLASTQRDIAQQLAEASFSNNPEPEPCKQQQGRSNQIKKKDTKCVKKVNPKRKSRVSDDDSLTSIPKALTCSYEECNRKFASLTHLKYHEMTHTNNRQFECPDKNCGKTFFTAQRLNVHLRTHTGERPFKCSHEDCGKTFTTAGNLKNHERIHTGEQPFLCDVSGCNRRFTEYSSLHKHKLTHSGDKPFKCKVCDKKFTQSGSRRQHLIRHHLDEEIRNSLKGAGYSNIDHDEEGKGENHEEIVRDIHHSVTGESKLNGHVGVPCSPQLMVLSNAFRSHSTSESVVFAQGVSEQLVSLSTHNHLQSNHQHHHQLSEPSSHTLLSSNDLYEENLDGKPSELVSLPQASIYQHEDQGRNIVYATDMLDHDEGSHTNYHVSTQVDAAVEYHHHPHHHHHHHHPHQNNDNIQTDVSLHNSSELHHPNELHHADLYQSHQDYIQPEDLHHPVAGDYTEVKGEISSHYLAEGGEVLHGEFIGTKEVTISSTPGLVEVPEEDLVTDNSFIPVKEGVSALMDWDEQLQKH